MKHCPPKFKADAVALYESRAGAAIKSVAADLGVNPETLRNWIRAAGVGSWPTKAEPTPVPFPAIPLAAPTTPPRDFARAPRPPVPAPPRPAAPAPAPPPDPHGPHGRQARQCRCVRHG
ncbi:transposase [Streptomyces sp. ISL-98]|uniref:transposase n=1 Tax=Streptomyces sp. ISL-98 TaxID=2819192 RepID=UPI0035AFB06C